MMFLQASTKQTVFSIMTRKDEVPRHYCHPLRSRSWLRGGRSQVTALSGPGRQTAQLSSLREPGTQETQLALKVLRPPGQRGPGLADCIPCRLHPMQTDMAIKSQRQGEGRDSPSPQGLGPAGGQPWLWLQSPAGHSPSLFPVRLSSAAG